MITTRPDLRSFVDNGLYKIKGFLNPVDAMIFSDILNFQTCQGYTGAVAEIGVFYGRSFTLMAKAITSEEKALGIDLYDIDGQLDYVKKTLTDESLENYTLHVGSSTEITCREIKAMVGDIRFFSVDGGHEQACVEYDSELSLDCLSPDGIIAFDDFFNPRYPDLTVAVIKFIAEHEVTAFCITRSKLYVCKPERYEAYLDFMKTAPLWANAYRESFQFMGREVVHPTQSMMNRAIYQTLSEKGLGKLGGFLTKTRKLEFARE